METLVAIAGLGSLSGLIQIAIALCVIAGFCWLVWWFVNRPGVPQPVRIIAWVVLAVVCLIALGKLVGGGL